LKRETLNRGAIAESVRKVMGEVLGIPAADGPVLFVELDGDSFNMPAAWSSERIFVELTIFPGRKPETKARLLAGIVAEIATGYGVAPQAVLVVLQEPPLENWGIRGGQQASQLALGFALDV
jgi:phenylpyruvate tautomerase PptA (4-oxalocrotonate tautomerase family)